MMRTTLDFETYRPSGNIYLRFINDEPAFLMLHSTSKRKVLVPQLTIHIDFMKAELYPHDVGSEARGLGAVEFGGGMGPRIVGRDVSSQRAESYGLVFDISSPYPLPELEPPLVIKSHPLGSTMRNCRIGFGEAYQQYLHYVQRDTTMGGIILPRDPGYQVPVFDVLTWRRRTDEKDGFGKAGGSSYIPNFDLVGMVSHIDEPLSEEARQKFADLGRGRSARVLAGVPDEASPILPEFPTDQIPLRRPKLRAKQSMNLERNDHG